MPFCYYSPVLTAIFTNSYKTQIPIPLPGFVPIPDVAIINNIISQSEPESEPMVVLPHPRSLPSVLRHNHVVTRSQVSNRKEASTTPSSNTNDSQVCYIYMRIMSTFK